MLLDQINYDMWLFAKDAHRTRPAFEDFVKAVRVNLYDAKIRLELQTNGDILVCLQNRGSPTMTMRILDFSITTLSATKPPKNMPGYRGLMQDMDAHI